MQIYVLNRARETLATTSGIYDDKHTLTLDAGSSSYEFKISKNDEASQYMDSGNYIVLQDDDGKTWLFTILDYEETQYTKTVYAEDAGIELLNKACDVWKSNGPHSFEYYFNLVTSGTPWKLGVNQLAGLERTLTYEGRDTGLGRLLSILKGFDNAECTFDVSVKMNAPSEFKINVYKSVGSDRSDVQMVYSHELNDIVKKESRAEFVTALCGVGGTIQTTDAQGNTQDTGNIDFADLEYNKDGLVTTKGDKFLRAIDANKRFNPGQATYIEAFYEYDTQSASELLNRTITRLKTYSEPQYTYTADVKVIDSTLKIGDTVTIIDHDYNPALYLSARVAKLEKSYTDPAQNTIEFCNYQLLSSRLADKLARLQTVVNKLPSASQVAKIESNVTDLSSKTDELASQVTSANGKNTNYYGKLGPTNPKNGDLWYKDLNNGETEMYQYQNGNWELITSTAELHNTQKEVDQAIKDFNAQFKEIDDKYVPNETYQTEKQAFSTAVTKASETAQAAKATADTASANATEANSSASEARAKVDDVAKTVTKNGKAIGEIKSDVSSVKANYATLDGKVTSVSARAGAVEAALSDGKGGLISVKAENNRIESLVDSKVDDSEYNTFKQQTSTTLSQKANKTDLNGYVTGTQFKQTADKVDTLASDVKSVKTKTDTIETTMKSTSFANSVVKASGIDTKVAGYDTTIRKLIGKDGATGDLDTLVSAYSNETNQTKKQTTNLISALDYNGTTGNFGSGFAKKVADAYGTTESYKALNGKIDGLQIGGANLLDNTAGPWKKVGIGKNYTDTVTFVLNEQLQNTTITVSFDCRANARKDFYCFFFGGDYSANGKVVRASNSQGWVNNSIGADGMVLITPSTTWERVWIRYELSKIPPAGIKRMLIGRLFSNYATSDWLEIRNVKLESGNKATDWCMSDGDINKRIQDQADALTAYQAEVKRTYALSSSVYTKTETQTRENALKSSTISDLKATDDWKKLIKINQNSSWIQDATGFQQQAWKYNLDSSGQLIGKKSFEDGTVGEWMCNDYKTKAVISGITPYSAYGYHKCIYTPNNNDLYWNVNCKVNPGDKYYVELLVPNFYSAHAGRTITVTAYFRYVKDGKSAWQSGPSGQVTTGTSAWIKGVITVPDNVTSVKPCIGVKDNGATSVVHLTYASFTKLDDYTQSNMTSIKQSSDGIGLKVAQLVGGSDISKIDMTSAAVKIDSKHILLNGDVAIDGTTFAKKIKATGITADMMLAGTIDAAKINVINIDASKITTGTLTAVEMHQNGGGTDTWINKDGIHNQMGSNNVWVKRGTLAAFDSNGQGMYMEQGRLTLASFAYWQNGLNLEGIDYGVIKCDSGIFDKKGIGVIGIGGFNVRTDNCDLTYLTGLASAISSGAGIIGDNSGKMILGSDKGIFITAGRTYANESALGMNDKAYIKVGGQLSAPTNWDKEGSSVVISAWDIKLNACGKDNRNIILNRLTYNGEHTINLNDGTSDLWWGPKMHAPSFVNTSALSKKMNIKKLDVQTAVNAIKNTDIYDYQFKEFGETGKHYASLIIDDVNDKPQYRAAGAFVDGLGRDDGTQLGYLTVVVQSLLKEIDTLKERIDK